MSNDLHLLVFMPFYNLSPLDGDCGLLLINKIRQKSLSLRLYNLKTSASSLSFFGFDTVSGHVGEAMQQVDERSLWPTASRGLRAWFQQFIRIWILLIMAWTWKLTLPRWDFTWDSHLSQHLNYSFMRYPAQRTW